MKKLLMLCILSFTFAAHAKVYVEMDGSLFGQNVSLNAYMEFDYYKQGNSGYSTVYQQLISSDKLLVFQLNSYEKLEVYIYNPQERYYDKIFQIFIEPNTEATFCTFGYNQNPCIIKVTKVN